MIHMLKKGGRAAIVLPDGSLTGDGVKQRIRQKLLEDCNLNTIVRLPNSVFQPYASVARGHPAGTAGIQLWACGVTVVSRLDCLELRGLCFIYAMAIIAGQF